MLFSVTPRQALQTTRRAASAPSAAQPTLSPFVLRACPFPVPWDGCPAGSGVFAAPRWSCPCLSCTMTIPASGLGLSIFIQSKVSASLSRPVVEATLEGMVGILRLSHSQAGRNASVGGGQGRGGRPETSYFSALLNGGHNILISDLRHLQI